MNAYTLKSNDGTVQTVPTTYYKILPDWLKSWVHCGRHFVVTNVDKNWQSMHEFKDWYNNAGLCSFVDVSEFYPENQGITLSTTVY
jgi:hypothetical protein